MYDVLTAQTRQRQLDLTAEAAEHRLHAAARSRRRTAGSTAHTRRAGRT